MKRGGREGEARGQLRRTRDTWGVKSEAWSVKCVQLTQWDEKPHCFLCVWHNFRFWRVFFLCEGSLSFIIHWILSCVFPLLPLNLAPSTVREVSIPPDKVASYSIEVRWLPPEKLNGKIGYYFYYWETSAGQTTAKRFVIPGSVHYKLVSGLRPFTNYTFSVVPYNLRKNLSGKAFDQKGQTSPTGTCMHFTAFTRTFIYYVWKNPSSSWKSKSRPSRPGCSKPD